MTSRAYDVVIIGAGIVGAACAAECAREGLSVVVIERQMIGGGATSAGMGHIVVMDDSGAQFELTSYSQMLWNEIASELPADCEFETCGTIWVAADKEEMEEVKRKHEYYETRGLQVEVLDTQALEEAEPNLRKGLAGGLRVPGDSVLYPPCVARFLVEHAQAGGADIRAGVKVVELNQDGVRLSDGSFVTAGVTVNATGSWSPQLTPGLKVQPRKGHLVITERYPAFVHHQLIELGYLKSEHASNADSEAFNIKPRKTGQLLIGSSRQYGATDSQVDTQILNRMLARSGEYLPGLDRLIAIRTWTGFRAATPDKLPMIGPCPAHDWLYHATVHEGLGLTTSLGPAKLLVDQITNSPPAIPIEPYLPTRFAVETAHA
jgi:glycine/D-amino acid oxidase-like deaminating enzyme